MARAAVGSSTADWDFSPTRRAPSGIQHIKPQSPSPPASPPIAMRLPALSARRRTGAARDRSANNPMDRPQDASVSCVSVKPRGCICTNFCISYHVLEERTNSRASPNALNYSISRPTSRRVVLSASSRANASWRAAAALTRTHVLKTLSLRTLALAPRPVVTLSLSLAPTPLDVAPRPRTDRGLVERLSRSGGLRREFL